MRVCTRCNVLRPKQHGMHTCTKEDLASAALRHAAATPISAPGLSKSARLEATPEPLKEIVDGICAGTGRMVTAAQLAKAELTEYRGPPDTPPSGTPIELQMRVCARCHALRPSGARMLHAASCAPPVACGRCDVWHKLHTRRACW
jgi:hypothetical protein